MAQQISVEEAKQSVKQFLGASRVAKVQAADSSISLAYTAEENGDACFYVFNIGTDGGFVITGADEAAQEILAYSESGTFDYATAPDNVKWWLGQYEEQIAEGIKQGVKARGDVAESRMRKAAKQDVADLIKTKWNQSFPFNSGIADVGLPREGEYALVTGCVATAMSQVMKYYEYPTKGIGSASCDSRFNGVTFSANFGNTTYDWSGMKLEYTGKEDINSREAKAVGTLMYHAGVSVNMKYGQSKSGGSSAATAEVGRALVKYFGYDKAAQCLSRGSYSNAEWEQIVYDEIKAGRPVMYSGAHYDGEKRSGHAFICHGYSANKNMYSINWGWGGYCDGYYALSGTGALRPDGSGIGGAGAGNAYSTDQEILVGIQPDKGNDYIYSLTYDNTTSLESNEVTRGLNVVFHAAHISFNSYIKRINNPEIGVKVTNKATNKVSYFSLFTRESQPFYGISFNGYSFSTGTLEAGQYTLTLAIREEGKQWIDATPDATAHAINLTVKPTENGVFTTKNLTVGVNGKFAGTTEDLKAKITILNDSKTKWTKTFTCDIYVSKGNGWYGWVAELSKEVTLEAGEEKEIIIPFNFKGSSLNVGDDCLAILSIDNEESNNKYSFVVTAPLGAADFDGNGAITVDDAVGLVNQILAAPAGTMDKKYDLNKDGKVNHLDAIEIVKMWVNGK